MSTVQGHHPFSLLAVVLLTQPRKLLAFARCWLMFSSIHIKSFHWPASQQSPACIVYSFPSAGQGFCSFQFQEVPILSEDRCQICLCLLGGLSLSFQRCPLQVSSLGCSLPGAVNAYGLSSPETLSSPESSSTAGHLLQLCLSVLRPGGPFW